MNVIYFNRLKDIEFSKLMSVYAQSNSDNCRYFYHALDYESALQETEQDFYEFLRVFFSQDTAIYAIAEENGAYLSALRMERFKDGLIVQALETRPDQRGRGLASALLRDSAQYAGCLGFRALYSHVEKSNSASIRVHTKENFKVICDHAVYVDGSVSQGAYTFCKIL